MSSHFKWSLASATDAALYRRIGNVRVCDTHAMFTCSDNPFYRWGNRIHFGHFKTYTDTAYCEKLMSKEFEAVSGIKHRAFSWDVASFSEFPTEPWEALGYGVDYNNALTLSEKPSCEKIQIQGISVRQLTSDLDWQQAQEVQNLVRSPQWQEKDFRAYLNTKFSAYRRLTAENQGVWFAAFNQEGLQLANLGLLYCPAETQPEHLLVRFQMVATHPDYQGRGICKLLLQEAIQHLFQYAEQQNFKSLTAVIAADPDYHAKNIYLKAGFKEREYQVVVSKQIG